MRRLGAPVAAVLLAAAVPAAAQSVRAGIDAWQSGNPARAVEIWRPLAEKGDADAAFNLGQAYRLGRGVPLNLAAAQTWLERAARKDHLDAQTTLGLLLFQNGNRVTGLRWLRTAADKGEPRAMLIYGTALFNGDGVVQDRVRAYAYVSRAAAQGLAAARTTLDDMDDLMPVPERQKGVALAQQMAKPSPGAAPKPVPAASGKAAAKAPPPKPAARPAAPVAIAPVPAAGGWRIQLGAFSQRGSAEALFRRLSGALGGRQPVYVAAGTMTRLQIGPYPSRAAAQAACAALKGQACFPVPGK